MGLVNVTLRNYVTMAPFPLSLYPPPLSPFSLLPSQWQISWDWSGKAECHSKKLCYHGSLCPLSLPTKMQAFCRCHISIASTPHRLLTAGSVAETPHSLSHSSPSHPITTSTSSTPHPITTSVLLCTVCVMSACVLSDCSSSSDERINGAKQGLSFCNVIFTA